MIRSPVVAGAAIGAKCEVANGAPGRIRLAEITDFSAPALHGFIAANGAPGITIRTDVWSGYPGAPDVAHDPHVIGPIAAHVVLPWIHRVFSNLKTWGVYHRSAQETPAGLSRRIRFPFQSPSRSASQIHADRGHAPGRPRRLDEHRPGMVASDLADPAVVGGAET